MQRILVLATIGVLAGCAKPSTAPEPLRQELVTEALSAKVGGLGGCPEVRQTSASLSEYFPDLVLYSARCTREHGSEMRAIIGLDDVGGIFLFDSPASYRLLLRRHGGKLAGIQQPLEFSWWALMMSGALSGEDELLADPNALAALPLTEYGALLSDIRLSQVVSQVRGGWHVRVTTASDTRILSFHVALRDSGAVVFTLDRTWVRHAIH
jgi:hypothetical protein